MDNRKKLVKQQYLLHMLPEYGEPRPTNGADRLTSLGTPQISMGLGLGFVTAPTSLNGGQPNFAWCLTVSWASTLYIQFRGLLSANRILPGAKFTFRPTLRSTIFAALLQGTRVVGVSQTLRRSAEGVTYICDQGSLGYS